VLNDKAPHSLSIVSKKDVATSIAEQIENEFKDSFSFFFFEGAQFEVTLHKDQAKSASGESKQVHQSETPEVEKVIQALKQELH